MKQKRASTGGRKSALQQDQLFRKSKSDLVVMVRDLEAENDELKLQLGMDSTNSSKPPSSDSLAARGKRELKGKRGGARKRKPGGQPGHKGHHRKLLDPEEVDEIQTLVPGQCEHCGTNLTGDDPNPIRHQVWEIPNIKPRVTEYQMASLPCSCCGKSTRASLPASVPAGNFGLRTMVVIAYLTGAYRMSKRGVQELLQTLFDIPIAVGSISAIESRVSDALEAPVDEAKHYIQSGTKTIYADETGWREGRQKAWLWLATTGTVAVFMIHLRRSKEAAMELLGDFAGVLVTDRAGAYNGHPGKRQFCWAHLLRDFVAYSLRAGEAGRIGRKLVIKSCTLFRLWHRVRDGTLSE
ncbi:MAG: IS66 family transposase, partial [Lentisphaeria bacterium]|nr:IS66 family transposase [Lentisphaeria bacterium]